MSGIPPARRSRTSSPPAEMREFSRWPRSAPPAATTSGSRSAQSAWRCAGSSCLAGTQVEKIFPSWPGSSRPSTAFLLLGCKDVDARHKAGHDDAFNSSLSGENWIASSRMLLANDENEQSHHILSAVDRERRAGDGAGLVGGEERHGAGDFVGLAEAIDRDQRQDAFLQHLLRHRLHPLGVDIARADRVHGNAALGILQRERLGEADIAGLRRL